MALAIVLLVLAAAATLVWTSRHYMIFVERRTGFELTGNLAGPPADAPPVSVVVAAKDEEANIGACVRSMLAQDYPNFELIVCNDRSTDRTAQIVEEIARQDSRLRLVNIKELPDGWYGKNNAMQNGVATTKSPWICLIDADCNFFSPRTLSVAMQYARDKKSDFLSVLPLLEMKGFWENVIQPVCSGVMIIWFHPDKVNNPAKSNAYANGAFMLMKRETYEAIGTHQAVKQCLNEDMHMARIAKEKGLRLRVVRGAKLFSVRMYTNLKQMVRGWSRIFFGTFGTFKRLTASLAVTLIMGLLPYLTAVLGLTLAASGADHSGLWLATGLLAALAATLQLTVMYRYYGLIDGRPWLFWTYPLGSCFAVLSLCLSLSRLRKGSVVTWRGTACKTN
jgi:chlorobactene glucosyltransferase